MSWRDNLRQASFRGVPFKVLDSSASFGRRNVLHEYPFKDVPYVEDLGRSAQIFNVVGYVIQNIGNDMDYFAERDALIEAVEESGPATLVHPFLGQKFVAVQGPVRIDESFSQGGIARISMTLVEAGESISPSDVADYEGAADAAADSAQDTATDAFTEAYDDTGPDFITGVKGAVADIKAGLAMVQSTIQAIQSEVVGDISEALTTVAEIRDSIEAISKAPAKLAAAIKNTFATYKSFIPNVSGTSIIDSLIEITKFGKSSSDSDVSIYGGILDTVIPLTTDSREQQASNRKVIIGAFQASAAIEAVRAAAFATYDSYDQSQAVLVALFNAIDDVLDTIGNEAPYSDELYNALQGLKPLAVDAIVAKGASLPTVRDYQLPPDVMPSLVIAHNQYEDLDRESEIIDRNPVKLLHPGFPSPGEVIEVLSE